MKPFYNGDREREIQGWLRSNGPINITRQYFFLPLCAVGSRRLFFGGPKTCQTPGPISSSADRLPGRPTCRVMSMSKNYPLLTGGGGGGSQSRSSFRGKRRSRRDAIGPVLAMNADDRIFAACFYFVAHGIMCTMVTSIMGRSIITKLWLRAQHSLRSGLLFVMHASNRPHEVAYPT